MFHYISVFQQEKMVHFLDTFIRPKKKMFIGSVPQRDVERLVGKIDYYVNIPAEDAYYKIDEWWPKVLEHIDDVELCLPAGGMAGRIINKRLWKLNKDIHSIDLGSVIDAACNVHTRTWIVRVGDKIKNILLKEEPIEINYNDVSLTDLSSLQPLISRDSHRIAINDTAGKHHYKLLGYLSNITNNANIIELGTHNGTSSTALSINPNSSIRTYDVKDFYTVTTQPNNVERVIGNIFDLKEEHLLLETDFIFLDTLHEGLFERQIFNYLAENSYNGFIIYDDIHWSQPMIDFWKEVPDNVKYDITEIGHGDENDKQGPAGNVPGTGLIDFSNRITINKQ